MKKATGISLGTLLVCLLAVCTPQATAAVIRVVAYNVHNKPDNPNDDAWFETVFSAIEEESRNGIAKRPDIVALSETDANGSEWDSSIRLVNVLNRIYGVATYDVVTASHAGGDRTGVVYDTCTLSLLDSEDVPGTWTHPIKRCHFQPTGLAGPDLDFYVYAVHLKAGESGQRKYTRGLEAAALRADADDLGEGARVLFAGDFDIYRTLESCPTSEGAYHEMLALGNAHSIDLADLDDDGNDFSDPNQDIKWDCNDRFINYHTYETGYGLDPDENAMNSRFDFMFATDELTDGVGLDYVEDSFHVFGNDGTHDFNCPIDSNNTIPLHSDVLKALKNASEHLPIVADFEIPQSREMLGDADCDGDVDAFDYVALKRNVGKTGAVWEEGDFNGDGDVDRGDFVCLRAHFGDRVPGASGAFIPEPGALAMLAVGGLVIVRRKRGRGNERKHAVRRTGVSRVRVTPRPAGR